MTDGDVDGLIEQALADSLESLRDGDGPFAPHLMLLGGPAGSTERTLQHVRFGPDLAEGLAMARARVAPGDGTAAYAIAWDGFATVAGERTDAVLLEAGSATDPLGWLYAQPYGPQRRRLRAPRIERLGELLLVERPPSRLAQVV